MLTFGIGLGCFVFGVIVGVIGLMIYSIIQVGRCWSDVVDSEEAFR